MENQLKVNFFCATVAIVLLYGAESWMLTTMMSDRLDGTYTKMLRAVLGVSWKDHKTKSCMAISRRSQTHCVLEDYA